MITDTKKGGAGRRHVSAYARYMVSAKDHPDAKPNERVLLVQSDGMVSPAVPDPSNSKACRDFAKSVAQKHQAWIEETRDGKPAPKSWFQSGSISFSESDSKGLTPQQALDITREAVAEVMGADRPCLYAVHGDTDCLHVHFLASSVDSKGRIYAKPYDFRDWEKSMERLEIAHGLERVLQRKALADDPRREIKIKAPSRAELEIAVKDGTPSPKMQALAVLDAAKAEAKTMTEFMDMVEAHGYEIVPGSGTEKIAGYKLRCPDGVMIKGSDFGKSYSWGGIVKGGITYVEDRDFAAVDVRRKREASRTFGVDPEVRADRAEPSPNPSISGPAPATPAPTARGGNGNDPARNPSQSGNRFDALVERLRTDAGFGKKGPVRNDPTGPRSNGQSTGSGERDEHRSDKDIVSSGRDKTAGEREPRREDGARIVADRSYRGSGIRNNSDRARRDDLGERTAGRGHSEGNPVPHPATAKATAAVPRHIEKQIEAWTRQVRALGLTNEDKIRVTVVSRRGGAPSGIPYPDPLAIGMQTAEQRNQGKEVFWTLDDIRKNIESGRFDAWNKNRDVLITPYSQDHHFVFVDDTKPEALKKAGYTPCLVQETSKDNYQAIIKVQKIAGDVELVAINRLCNAIGKAYGDVGAAYAEHSFRCAGFANRKPDRHGEYTTVDMRNSQYGHVCKTANAELQQWREAVVEARKNPTQENTIFAQAERDHNLVKIEANAPDQDCQIVAGAIRRWTGIMKKNGDVDDSAVDYKVTEELLTKKWDKQRIANALHAMSPNLEDRKGKWSEQYISRTIDKAQQAVQIKISQEQRWRRLVGADEPKQAPKIVKGLSEQQKPEEPQQRRSYGPSMR